MKYKEMEKLNDALSYDNPSIGYFTRALEVLESYNNEDDLIKNVKDWCCDYHNKPCNSMIELSDVIKNQTLKECIRRLKTEIANW